MARMIYYGSRTGTGQQLDIYRRAGWRVLVSATGVLNRQGMPWALDNGAWTAHQQRQPFDGTAFRAAIAWGLMQPVAPDWVAIPDVVGDASATWRSVYEWLPRIPGQWLRLLVVQDGMSPALIRSVVGLHGLGIFVGGSTDWKWSTVPLWAEWAQRIGCYCHVGRVNTQQGIRACLDAGVDSCDGSGVARFAIHARKMEGWLRDESSCLEQQRLFGGTP